MKKAGIIFGYLFLLLWANEAVSQKIGEYPANDSLYSIFRNVELPDSVRLKAIDDMAWFTVFEDPDSAYRIAREQFFFALEKGSARWQSSALNTIGVSYHMKSDYETALDYYLASLKIREGINDKRGIAISLGNIGLLYEDLSDFEKSLEYQFRSLDLEKETNNTIGIASSYGNIGATYMELKDFEKALDFQLKSLALEDSIGNLEGMASSLGNIGLIYVELRDYDLALNYQMRCLAIEEQQQNDYGIATIKGNIAANFLRQKKYSEAIAYAKEAIRLIHEIGDSDAEKDYMRTLYVAYKETGDYQRALDNFEKYISIRDSIFKEEKQAEITRKEIKFEYEKKATADSVRRAEEQIIKDAEAKEQLKRSDMQRNYLFGGLALVLLFTFFMMNRLMIIRKQKRIIELQKQLVEEKAAELGVRQKEILDSIIYAKRLQQAILATSEEIDNHLPENFLLYKPKDIVAGDFYFFESKNEFTFIAAADCTGHGVPGAMISIVCDNALMRSINEFNLTDPGAILDKTRELVMDRFKKSGLEVKDGMDISLLCYNSVTRKISWSGANLPLWMIHESDNEMIQFRPNKQPIGKTINPEKFTTHEMDLKPGTTFYLFTDGYQDQFGGDKKSGNKKFKASRLKELLTSIHNTPMINQKMKLEKEFEDWKGDLEQLDDVCIIGVKL